MFRGTLLSLTFNPSLHTNHMLKYMFKFQSLLKSNTKCQKCEGMPESGFGLLHSVIKGKRPEIRGEGVQNSLVLYFSAERINF